MVGKVPLCDQEMGFQEAVQLLHRGGLDVEQQQLAWRSGLEIAQHLGMVLVPIPEPASFELSFGVNALGS